MLFRSAVSPASLVSPEMADTVNPAISLSLILLLCIGALAAGLVVSCLLDDKKIKEGFARQHSEVHTIKE